MTGYGAIHGNKTDRFGTAESRRIQERSTFGPYSALPLVLLLTFPIAVLVAIAAGAGAFITGFYRGAPFYRMMAIGQDCF
jgi:hypothetical protein